MVSEREREGKEEEEEESENEPGNKAKHLEVQRGSTTRGCSRYASSPRRGTLRMTFEDPRSGPEFEREPLYSELRGERRDERTNERTKRKVSFSSPSFASKTKERETHPGTSTRRTNPAPSPPPVHPTPSSTASRNSAYAASDSETGCTGCRPRPIVRSPLSGAGRGS